MTMDKEKYITPAMELVEFEAEDIMNASVESDELPFMPIKPQ